MTPRLLLPARQELSDAVRYCNAQRTGLGTELAAEARPPPFPTTGSKAPPLRKPPRARLGYAHHMSPAVSRP